MSPRKRKFLISYGVLAVLLYAYYASTSLGSVIPVIVIVGMASLVIWGRSKLFGTAVPQAPRGPWTGMPGNIRFRTTRLDEGYDMGEVDAFLERCDRAVQLRDRSMTPDQIAQTRFTPVWLREGYHMADVDAHLNALEEAFRVFNTGLEAR